jgi:hypothetical protein
MRGAGARSNRTVQAIAPALIISFLGGTAHSLTSGREAEQLCPILHKPPDFSGGFYFSDKELAQRTPTAWEPLVFIAK